MGNETFVVGGYVLGETLGTLTEEEVFQVDTTLNQDDNSYTVRFYGRDGELIQERQIPVEWSESELTSIDEEDLPVRGVRLDTNATWEADLDMRYPHMTYDGTGMNFYGEDGELLWRADREEEQPDIQDERSGALDEFLEKFTPQKITPERSDEQK